MLVRYFVLGVADIKVAEIAIQSSRYRWAYPRYSTILAVEWDI